MKDPKRFYTYAYLREDGTPYYIGKGSGRRIDENKGRPCKKPKNDSKIIFLKQNLNEAEAFKHEKYMIALFGRKDLETGILHNRTDGGEGISGFSHSENTKRKISKSHMGKVKGCGFKGRTHTDETKKKISDTKTGKVSPNKGKKMTPEQRKRISDGKKGKPLSEEHKIKLSKSLIGRVMDAETIMKIKQSKTGKKHSEETKIKCGIKNKGKRWWNDGTNVKFCIECPDIGWVLGRIRH